MKRPVAGWLVLGLGILHSVATVPAVAAALPFISKRGWLGGIATALPPPAEAMHALAALFSAIMGVLLLLMGCLLVRMQRAGVQVPRWFGATLVVTGLVGGVLLPPSGFWLVAAAGVFLVVRRS